LLVELKPANDASVASPPLDEPVLQRLVHDDLHSQNVQATWLGGKLSHRRFESLQRRRIARQAARNDRRAQLREFLFKQDVAF
jgi:hypothetical protein